MTYNSNIKKPAGAKRARLVMRGKALVSALLVVTLAFMSYSPSIAVAANSSSDQPSTVIEAALRTVSEEANAVSGIDGQAGEAAQEGQDAGSVQAEQGQDASDVPASPAEDTPSAEEVPAAEASAQSAAASSATAASGSATAADSSSQASQPAADATATLERTLQSSTGGTYTVKVKYTAEAAIPEGAKLEIVEYVQEPSDPDWRLDPAYDGRPRETERFVSADYLADRSAVAAKGLGAGKADYIYFSKFLDVAIVHDGQEVLPQAPVQVTIETTAIDVACSDGLQLARMVYDKDVANDEQAVKDGRVAHDGKTAKSLGAKNLTYDADEKTDRIPADDKIVKLAYSTKEFGELALEGIAVPKATVWQDELGTVQVLGPAPLQLTAYDVDASGYAEDEELLGAYAFNADPDRDHGTMLYARAIAAEGARADQASVSIATLFGYGLQGGTIAGEAAALGNAGTALAFKAADGFALVRKVEAAPQDDAQADQPSDADAADAASAANALVIPEPTLYLSQTVTTFDGASYGVVVSYGFEAGIPEDATLSVRELSDNEQELYRAQTEQALGVDELSYMRAFDIAILDGAGNEVEPQASVDVSITLEGSPDLDDSSVVHFGEGSPDVIQPTTTTTPASSTLDFTTDEFSVYVIVGTPIRTYNFWIWSAEYQAYVEYWFQTDSGDTTYYQKVKGDEKPVVPQPASDSNKSFVGWCEGSYEGSSLVLADQPYDFDAAGTVQESETVDLYAKFDKVVYVVFHDQYDTDTDSFPVAYTRRGVLSGDAGSSATVVISDLSLTYNGSASGDGAMAFYGWWPTPIKVPGSAVDEENVAVDKIQTDSISVSETTHLYPVFKSIHWVNYYSGPAKSGATFIPSATCFTDVGFDQLPVPQREGYVFDGWCIDEQTATPVTDGDGKPLNVNNEFVQTRGNSLYLKKDTTLYAKWVRPATASYTVAVWTQKASDYGNADDASKQYDLDRTEVVEVALSADQETYEASVPEALTQLALPDAEHVAFTCRTYDQPAEYSRDASAVLNVYYDRTVTPVPSNPYTIVFTDSDQQHPSADLISEYTPEGIVCHVNYGTSLNLEAGALSQFDVPAKPESGQSGYQFSGWYADAACTIRAFFANNADYRDYEGSKVLYETMPDKDLTIYAGWEKLEYLVQIDPNYGSLNGTGSTWFWADYGEAIQEYTQVTREFVESSSGTWYYMKHDRAYYGYPDTRIADESGDRMTKYTTNPGEATEFTTFEEAPNAYRYAGWYRVDEDGTETPYDFTQPVTSNVNIKLHWKKLGSYHIVYNPNATVDGVNIAGQLDSGDANEEVLVELDNGAYADNATVVISRSVKEQPGYLFAGWKVRGDESGTVYGVGQAFTLLSSYATSVNGKDTVFLDAVYTRVGTASITYDANGGTYDASAGEARALLGYPEDSSNGVSYNKAAATVGNLVNNSRFHLADGTGFSKQGAVLAGWSEKQTVDDPSDVFGLGATVGIDTDEPQTLYAAWMATVTYRLNDQDAEWSDGQTSQVAKQVFLNTPATLPDVSPVSQSGAKMFSHWATFNGTAYEEYDFTQPVTGPLTLYACWTDTATVAVHAADASSSQFVENDAWVKSGKDSISVSTANTAGNEVGLDAPTYTDAPGYTFAYAAVSPDVQSISAGNAATALYYDTEAKKVYVAYADPEKDDAPLGADDAVYFVYYEEAGATEQTVDVEVHVAIIDDDGEIVVKDAWRTTASGGAQFQVTKGAAPTAFLSSLPSGSVFTPDSDNEGVYAFGAVVCGTSEDEDGSPVTIDNMDVDAVSYEQVALAYGGSSYEPLLKASDGSTVGSLTNQKVYYLYYPKPQVQYVKENPDGSLTPVTGSVAGQACNDITYDGATLTMNGLEVKQGASFEIPMEGFVASQSVGNGSFNMPPILDDGVRLRYLSYDKIGAGDAGAATISDIDASDNLTMHLQVRDSKLEYSFDGANWQVLAGAPTIYAVYGERGYDLQVMKTVDTTSSGSDPVFSQAVFTVTISSMAITQESYAVEGIGVDTVAATPAQGETPGSIVFNVQDGTKAKVRGLSLGEYTIQESGNSSYNLTANVGPLIGDLEPAFVDDNSVLLTLDAEKRVELVNEPNPICKVVDGDEILFYTLTSAVRYIATEKPGSTGAVEMLVDYTVPAADAVSIPGGCNITFKTAKTGTYKYSGAGSALVTRGSNMTAVPMFLNGGSLAIEDVTLDGASVRADAALVQSVGSLTIDDGAQLINAVNTGNGGAVYATDGDITIQDATLSDNEAARGGAVYYSGAGTLGISGTKTVISGNTATNGDGGALFVTKGTVDLLDSVTISDNTAASGNGGAVYGDSAMVNVKDQALLSGNRAVHGGAVYIASGKVQVMGGVLTGNVADGGNGGAVCTGIGVVDMSAGVMTANSAPDGNGGAIYISSGESSVSGGQIGGALGMGNTAKNGSAVFVATNTATFSGGTIAGNIATDGGAVGVDADAVKLYFSGNVVVSGNTLGMSEANVYLDKNADTVINASNLGQNARIGVYVAGDMEADLFKKRGEPGGRFGSYTNVSSSVLTAVFSNDRLPSVAALADTDTSKIKWGKSIQVAVYLQESYANGKFPPVAGANPVYGPVTVYPEADEQALSELASSLYNDFKSKVKDAAYGGAFAHDATSFDDSLTHIKWDNEAETWTYEKATGEYVQADRLDLYYANPAFVVIENNTAQTLDMSAFSMLGKSAINVPTVPATDESEEVPGTAGYGFVFARNGAVQQTLLPIDQSDLVLRPYTSVKLLFPGATKNTKTFSLDGTLAGATAAVPLKVGGTPRADLTVEECNTGFTVDGSAMSTSPNTLEIIFGTQKPICKIAVDTTVQNALTGTIATSEYVVSDQDEEGTVVEYCFASISDAVAFVENHIPSKTATIEMLADYLIPSSDAVAIQPGYKITLTTALTGLFQYSGEQASGRATISRDSGNLESFFTVATGGAGTEIYIHDLDFDGKNLKGRSNGGALRTMDCKVAIENADFKNFIALYGGAIYLKYSEKSGYVESICEVFVKNATFDNCESYATQLQEGGGGIWTNARVLTLEDSTFKTCKSVDQGGAAFHMIHQQSDCVYTLDSQTFVRNCTFIDCESRAAGGIETDALYSEFDGCSFSNCKGTVRNSGALNVYIRDGTSGHSKSPSETKVTNCTFDKCITVQCGGGVRSTALKTTVSGCTFTNCETRGVTSASGTASHGGAIAITNKNATETTVSGCSITDCLSSQKGGGIFCSAKAFTVSGNTLVESCRSSLSGAGICHSSDLTGSTMAVEDTTVDDCVSSVAGGGIYSNAKVSVTLTRVTITNCTAQGTSDRGGGGLCVEQEAATTTLDATTIRGNTAAYRGGGVDMAANLTLRNGTLVTANRLTSNVAENAAGVFMSNTKQKTLTVGTEGATELDSSSVYGNTTANGTASNVRLCSDGNGVNLTNSVSVLCGLNGQIGVVNANKQGSQFGSATVKRPAGFTDDNPVFKADNGTIRGVIDNQDEDEKRIIWGGDPICKITDPDGVLLYFKNSDDEYAAATFDILDSRGPSDGSRTSAFCALRKPDLYYADGTKYPTTGSANSATYCVKMLVESYTMSAYVSSNQSNTGQTIILTTAEPESQCTDGHPYRGRQGSRATIIRGKGFDNDNMFTAKVNFEVRDIILDGANRSVTATNGGAIIYTKQGNASMTVTLGKNATLQNGVAVNSGGAVQIDVGSLVIDGASINNCKAANGAAVSIKSGKTFTFKSGSIVSCSATSNGGGVYIENATFDMQGGTIRNCSATGNGGGVFVANSKTMKMTNAFVTNNTATAGGGGIAVGGAGTRLKFSEKPTVSGNKLKSGDACNVQLDVDSNDVINVVDGGLHNGSAIGVYVPDGASLYDEHGVKGKPFGTIASGANTKTLYYFTNDRSTLKGCHLAGSTDNFVCWGEVFSLVVANPLQVSENAKNVSRSSLRNDTFSFHIELTGDATDGRKGQDINGDEFGEGLNFVDGKADFTLKNDGAKAIENLPQGLTYTITEGLPNNVRYKNYVQAPSKTQTGVIGEPIGNQSPEDLYTTRVEFTNIYPMCKVADANGNLLFKRFTNNYGIESKIPAVYTELAPAFTAIDNNALYVSQSSTDPLVSDTYRVEMLEPEYYTTTSSTIAANKAITLTTASTSDAICPYQGSSTSVAIIQRKFGFDGQTLGSGGSMFVVNGALTVNKMTLDGNKRVYTASNAGGIVNVSAGGSLTAQRVTLKNSLTQGNGGAINNQGTVTLANCTVQDNSSGGMGGAICNLGTLALTACEVKGNTSDGNGAGIYVAENSTLSLSGSASFGGTGVNAAGDIDSTVGNLKSGTLEGKTNGGRAHAYTKARQDIYLDGLGSNGVLSSLVVDSKLGASAGSIWVWAQAAGETDANNHCQVDKQFAVVSDTALAAMSDAQLAETLRAFRNARDDDATLNMSSTYLYGTTGEVEGLAYWSSPAEYRDAIMQKVDRNRVSFEGAVFTIYATKSTSSAVVRDANGVEQRNLRSLASGTIYVGDLPDGVYHMYESSHNRWFTLNVSESGVTCTAD